jgi:hypothetical protein
MQMTQEFLNYVSGRLRSEAYNARENAGWSGSYGDGGASSIESSIEMYEKGFRKEIPEGWKEYLEDFEKSKDPEYSKYIQLKNKFEK